VIAQRASLLMGARAMGLGNASACLADEWSVFNNPGGLAAIEKSTLAFSQNSHPSFKPFNRSAAVFAFPVGAGVAGLGCFRFGDDLYNEQLVSAAFSNKFGIASIGLKVSYVQYNAKTFGSKGVFTVSFGGIAYLTKTLSIGAHITNIHQPVIYKADEEEKVPARLATAVLLKASDKVFFITELEKDLDEKMCFKTGVEYNVHEKFFVRTGFDLAPDAAFFGLGFKPRRIAIDYAMQYDFNLGLNHQATAAFKFSRK
jgi:hypothetical protein